MGDVYKIKDGNIQEKMICRNGVRIVLDTYRGKERRCRTKRVEEVDM